MITKYLFFSLCFLITQSFNLKAQEVSTLIEKTSFQIEEDFEIGFRINAEVDSMHIPEFKGFVLLYGPNTSNNMSFANGVKKSEFILSYGLRPKKKGRIKIKSPIFFVEGERFEGKPIKLKILKNKKADKKPEKKVIKGTHYS